MGGPTSSYRPASTAVKFTDAHRNMEGSDLVNEEATTPCLLSWDQNTP